MLCAVMLSVVILIAVVLNAVIVSAFMLSAFMLSAFMLSAVMLDVVMLSVVGPKFIGGSTVQKLLSFECCVIHSSLLLLKKIPVADAIKCNKLVCLTLENIFTLV
jgi:hypothetical protein